jgi:hypothetical protein
LAGWSLWLVPELLRFFTPPPVVPIAHQSLLPPVRILSSVSVHHNLTFPRDPGITETTLPLLLPTAFHHAAARVRRHFFLSRSF